MKFSDYQRQALASDKTGSDAQKSLMVTLLGLAGETGSLLSEYKKWFREGDAYKPFSDQVSEELGDILVVELFEVVQLFQDRGFLGRPGDDKTFPDENAIITVTQHLNTIHALF